MTENQIRLGELQEKQRSNQKGEQQRDAELRETKRGNTIKGATSVLATFGKFLGTKNDPSWYNRDKQLVNTVANISYSAPLGSKGLGLRFSSVNDGHYSEVERQLAGFMCINCTPAVASTNAAEANAINIAAKNIYSFVRYANSGSRNYEAADLMMYLLSMDSAYIVFASLVRAYRAAMTRNPQNWYYPNHVLRAMGFDPEDFIQNLPRVKKFIQVLAVRLSSFYVPADFPYYARHIWMSSNIFSDNNIRRAASYIFRFSHIFKYSYDTENGTQLVKTEFLNDNLKSWAQVEIIANSIVSALITESDVGIMSGDILKAYGDKGVFNLGKYDIDEPIETVYSPEVLSQINGATVLGVVSSNNIIQDASTGVIYQGNKSTDPTLREMTVADPEKVGISHEYAILNMYKDDVKPDDNMVASRLCVTTTYNGNAKYQRITACGTELVTSVSIYGISPTTGEYRAYTDLYDLKVMNFLSIDIIVEALASFDWAPRIRLLGTNDALGSVQTAHLVYDNKDLCNFAVIDKTTLDRMHEVAAYSMFAVPVTKDVSAPRFKG